MKGSAKIKVFISYSWSSDAHRQWVRDLADRLSADGIYVILDEWDLKPGHDKYVFMEKMVTDETITKVLVICDRAYQAKADGRKGGVGTESQLISQEVYEKVDQEKFIPIIAERNEDGDPCMPKYMVARMYFDLSNEDRFEGEYQRLIRDLYGKPERTRPPLGTPPAYISRDANIRPSAASVLRDAGVSSTTLMSGLISDFFDRFLIDMDKYHISVVNDEPYDETMVKLIESMRPLRDVFVDFATKLAGVGLNDEELDLVHDYLSKMAQYQNRPYRLQEYRDADFDNYKFFCYEAVLYFVAVFISKGRFKEIAYLVNSTYFFESSTGLTDHGGINIFNEYPRSLEEIRNQRLKLNRVSIVADMIRSRAEGSSVDFDALLEADLILHYVTFLHIVPRQDWNWNWSVWFPRLSPFSSRTGNISLLEKMISKRFFERAKVLFDADTPQDLVDKAEQSKEKAAEYYRGMGFRYNVSPIYTLIKIDNLASVP